MANFTNCAEEIEEFLVKAKKVSKGENPTSAGIESIWLTTYASKARRCRDDKDLGLSRYPYEAGPSTQAFDGGFFPHRQWSLRKALEKHPSMRAVCEYETNYINASGFWMAFHQAAFALRQEALAKEKFDAWEKIAIRYGLRVVGLRPEFYKLAAEDPTYAMLFIPSLEKKNDMVAADDLVESIDKLDSHMNSQLMKAVATLSASNATRRAGNGATADKH